ncbi:MAG: hypothetical protein CMP51_02630 [Flavobacteriales bacterium]|nr:hypothetical protein [Flavobacteriales bacterium]|tara:strand:+ start:3882 stop:4535 length:654 start_codon:yes stop_codon:yes gene_type:complete
MIYKELFAINQNLNFIFLLFSYFIISYLYAYHYKISKAFIKSSIAERYAVQYVRDDNVFKQRVNLIFNLLLIFNISVTIWNIISDFQGEFSQWTLIAFIVGSFYLIKFFIIKFIGLIFLEKQISNFAIYYTFLFDKLFAIACLPLLVFLYYFTYDLIAYSLYAFLITYTIFFSIKVYWMIRIGRKYFGIPKFYLFLYICLLELMPTLLVSFIVINAI